MVVDRDPRISAGTHEAFSPTGGLAKKVLVQFVAMATRRQALLVLFF
jgi:hypothetical protein